MAAKTCAKDGLNTVLSERREDFRCVKFTQLLNTRICDFIKIDKKFVYNEIKGTKIISPDGTEIETHEPVLLNYAINREKFDEELVNLAVKNGTEFINKTRATGLIREDGMVKGIKAKIDEKEEVEIRSNIVIGAVMV